MNFKITFSPLLLFSFLISQPLRAQSQKDYFAPDAIYRFAEYLYKEGDYLRAAGEYKRYLYSASTMPSDADSVLYKIGLCYRKAKMPQKAVVYFRRVVDEYPKSEEFECANLEIGYSLFLMKKYKESILHLKSCLPSIKGEFNRLRIQQLIGVNYLYQKRWELADCFYRSLEKNTKTDSFNAALQNFAEEGKRLPKKSRFLAGLLSSIVPGAGKVYCERTWDGVFSLLVISFTGWQAYQGFKEEDLTRGWIYGVISGIFYLGNIYGSTVAANIYNEEREKRLLNKIEHKVNAHFN
jgi:tetratricopeptide (TPR) repeat protein